MIISFAFKNYLSFRDEHELSLQTGARLRKYKENTFQPNKTINIDSSIKLLKNVLIFGANGFGKSNVLAALQRMKMGILAIPKKSTTRIPASPYSLDDYSKDSPTEFTIEFISQGKQYYYSYAFLNNKIIKENLKLFNKNKYEDIIIRENTKFIVPKELTHLINETRENMLFIQVAQDKNHEHSINVMRWFDQQLIFFDKDRDKFKVLLQKEKKEQILKFLQAMGLYMKDITVIEDRKVISEEMKKIIENLDLQRDMFEEEEVIVVYKLVTIYNRYNKKGDIVGESNISFDMESEGTRKLIFLALNFLFADKNKVIIMDEFDDAFHKELSEALITLFNKNNNMNQFILTTHDLNLMNFSLRKDQIYFTHKEFDGSTELYSLFDFGEEQFKRQDINFLGRYLRGAYGALPYMQKGNICGFLEGVSDESK